MQSHQTSPQVYARVAGFTFLFYIVAGITSLVLASQPHATDVLNLLQNFSALVLGVTLYTITHKQGPGLAMLALTCRVVEAVHSEAAIFFGLSSLLFSWLFLRSRMIPVLLAWLGVLTSVLWVVGLPLQLAGVLPDSVTWAIYLPMLAFEVPLALWLMVKGVNVDRLKMAEPGQA